MVLDILGRLDGQHRCSCTVVDLKERQQAEGDVTSWRLDCTYQMQTNFKGCRRRPKLGAKLWAVDALEVELLMPEMSRRPWQLRTQGTKPSL